MQKRYRLRNGSRIVGYAEQTSHGVKFTGKYMLWWREGKENYDEVDVATGLKDKMNRMIFEGDIVYYRINKKLLRQSGVVVRKGNTFYIKDLTYNHFTPLEIMGFSLFNKEKLEIHSHIFNLK
ncbi:hypothetical protein KRX57_10590 [Weeksellaceae bacterium TAE3-ERU29]|nr:hypothetical protein [Weeksellaceae bacterium TAE3-ERU29]